MDTTYNTLIEVFLRPVYWAEPPTVLVGVNQSLTECTLAEPTWFSYPMTLPEGNIQLSVKFFGKVNSDTTATQDKAVIVDEVKLNQIADPKFVWASTYTPNYPEPWASEQTDLQPTLTGASYLGWNGTWTLDITVPVFTWIHRVRGLGWIYE